MRRYKRIKYFLREFILKILSLVWALFPGFFKIKLFNLVRAFYQRHKYTLVPSNLPGQRLIPQEVFQTISSTPLVSIIIPTFNQPYVLKECLDAIKKNTFYKNYEVILVDNNSFEQKSLDVMARSGHRVLKYSYKFNFSKINNFAARYAKGEYLLFLNNDTIPQKNWLVPMLNECQKDDVGIVGSKLLYSDKTIQHAGIEFNADQLKFDHLYRHYPCNHSQANKKSEVLAVTGACFMIKRDVFEQVGGFDEEYWLESQDVDLCYKVRQLGLKVIYTPFSVLYHPEKTTRGQETPDISWHDTLRIRKKWLNDFFVMEPSAPLRHHKILMIKLLTMGDVVVVTPIIEAMRKKFPQSEIVFATSQRYRDLIEGNPYLDKVYLCRDFNPSEFRDPLSYYRAITLELLLNESWDLVYPLQLLDLPYGNWGTDYHLRELYADTANINLDHEKPYLPVASGQREKMKTLIKKYVCDDEKIILLHTTSSWRLKDWDYGKYPILIRKLLEKYKAKFFQIGGKNDVVIQSDLVIPLMAEFSLKEIAALMELGDLLICPDTGLMHMATAMRLPVVALFGPTSPPTGGPVYGEKYVCIQSPSCCFVPCHMRSCFLGRDCAKDIDVEAVYEAASKILDGQQLRESWWRGQQYEGLGREVFNNRSGTGGFRV